MILPFSTELNGKPTYFVEKILLSLLQYNLVSIDRASELLNKPMSEITVSKLKPKHHTIREDIKNRWGVGAMINFFINNRRPDMFRFAPDLPVKSVQRISITHYLDWVSIKIDGREISEKQAKELAVNDGFDTLTDFMAYFEKDFTGKIIHWTDLKY